MLATLAGWFLRWAANQYQWRTVRKIAREELENPFGTNDPEKAVKNALHSVERKRIKTESKLISLKAISPPPISSSLRRRAGSVSDGNGGEHK